MGILSRSSQFDAQKHTHQVVKSSGQNKMKLYFAVFALIALLIASEFRCDAAAIDAADAAVADFEEEIGMAKRRQAGDCTGQHVVCPDGCECRCNGSIFCVRKSCYC